MSVINHIIIVDTFGHDNCEVRIWYRRHRVLETRVCISEVRETVWCLVQINMRVEFEGGRVERRRVEGRRRWCDIMELTTVMWIHPDSSHRMYLSWFDRKKNQLGVVLLILKQQTGIIYQQIDRFCSDFRTSLLVYCRFTLFCFDGINLLFDF